MDEGLKSFMETKLEAPVTDFQPVGGGSINKTGILIAGGNDFFIKINNAKRFPKMFETEAKGLTLIGATNTIKIPDVLFFDEYENYSFILMERIQRGAGFGIFWERFGKAMAELHKTIGPSFGLDHPNYIGSLHQSNVTHGSFVNFFVNERLEPQYRMAKNNGHFSESTTTALSRLYKSLPDILPEEPPTLIHGDLWSGNFMAGPENEPVLIDPAVCYAHREMDLSMTTLFGGFDELFYESYESVFPTAPGLEHRIDIYNLYYLLVHVNLFGLAYVSSVESILRRF